MHTVEIGSWDDLGMCVVVSYAWDVLGMRGVISECVGWFAEKVNRRCEGMGVCSGTCECTSMWGCGRVGWE